MHCTKAGFIAELVFFFFLLHSFTLKAESGTPFRHSTSLTGCPRHPRLILYTSYSHPPKAVLVWHALGSPQFSSVTQSCLTLRDPMDCSPPGSSVCGIFQARVLECLLHPKLIRNSNNFRAKRWVTF